MGLVSGRARGESARLYLNATCVAKARSEKDEE